MKSPVFLLLSLTILLANLTAQDTWQALPGAPNFIGPFSKLDDVDFVDANTGWTLNATGKVFKTTDGGATWTEKADLGEFLRCIKFVDAQVGYVASLRGSFGGPPSNAKIFKTTDGGDTWTDLTVAISPEPIGVCGLSVVDAQTVYGCGAFYGPARLYKSLDGGTSWTNIDLSAYATSVVDLHFFSPELGFVVGAGPAGSGGGLILKTTDGGDTWEVVHSTGIGSDLLWKIQALDRDHLYASIAGVSMVHGARILISADGGDTWTSKLVAEGEVHLQGVGFLDERRGFAGGFFDGVYATEDGGDNWELIEVGANYNRFQKIDDTLMYASGHTIYRYTSSPDTTITSAQELFPAPNYGLTVAPNPARDLVNVSYHLGNATHLQLALYDAQGREVRSFYRGWHPAGTFERSQPVGELPPGRYLLALLSREGDILTQVLIE
ncbi:MAG: YCF48-related protein [Bacteroidota bacterium]